MATTATAVLPTRTRNDAVVFYCPHSVVIFITECCPGLFLCMSMYYCCFMFLYIQAGDVCDLAMASIGLRPHFVKFFLIQIGSSSDLIGDYNSIYIAIHNRLIPHNIVMIFHNSLSAHQRFWMHIIIFFHQFIILVVFFWSTCPLYAATRIALLTVSHTHF